MVPIPGSTYKVAGVEALKVVTVERKMPYNMVYSNLDVLMEVLTFERVDDSFPEGTMYRFTATKSFYIPAFADGSTLTTEKRTVYLGERQLKYLVTHEN